MRGTIGLGDRTYVITNSNQASGTMRFGRDRRCAHDGDALTTYLPTERPDAGMTGLAGGICDPSNPAHRLVGLLSRTHAAVAVPGVLPADGKGGSSWRWAQGRMVQ